MLVLTHLEYNDHYYKIIFLVLIALLLILLFVVYDNMFLFIYTVCFIIDIILFNNCFLLWVEYPWVYLKCVYLSVLQV